MRFVPDWRKNTKVQQYKIVITELAERDLEQAADYIAYTLKNPSAAKNIVKGIRKQINRLRSYPKAHELDDDLLLADLGIRKTYYKEYKVYYITDDGSKTVYIVRILHMLVDSRTWMHTVIEK